MMRCNFGVVLVVLLRFILCCSSSDDFQDVTTNTVVIEEEEEEDNNNLRHTTTDEDDNDLENELPSSNSSQNKHDLLASSTITTVASERSLESNSQNNERQISNVFQELLRPSAGLHQELMLLNKHLDGVKAAFIRFEKYIKEELTGLQEDIQSLKVGSIDLEMDLQTSSDSLERIMEWTSTVDTKFNKLEKSVHQTCRYKTNEKLSENGPGIRTRCSKANRFHKKKKMLRRKLDSAQVAEDLGDKPQADSPDHSEVDNLNLGFWDHQSCIQEMKTEVRKMKSYCSGLCKPKASSCADIQRFGAQNNGVYTINPWISGYDYFVTVYCDLVTEGGGWTIIQRRDDFGPSKEDFSRNWTDYKSGFGDVNREFWLGNDIIYAMTNQEPVVLHIELESFSNETKFAEYSNFKINSDKENYKLHLGTYRGDAADSLSRSRNMMFSTQDIDNDKWTGNCARRFKGGWWFNNCHDANLNGHYYGGIHDSYADGVNWYHWKGFHYSLRRTEMKIRPLWFKEYLSNL